MLYIMIKGSAQRTWSRSFQPKLYSVPYTCNAMSSQSELLRLLLQLLSATWQHLVNQRC